MSIDSILFSHRLDYDSNQIDNFCSNNSSETKRIIRTPQALNNLVLSMSFLNLEIHTSLTIICKASKTLEKLLLDDQEIVCATSTTPYIFDIPCQTNWSIRAILYYVLWMEMVKQIEMVSIAKSITLLELYHIQDFFDSPALIDTIFEVANISSSVLDHPKDAFELFRVLSRNNLPRCQTIYNNMIFQQHDLGCIIQDTTDKSLEHLPSLRMMQLYLMQSSLIQNALMYHTNDLKQVYELIEKASNYCPTIDMFCSNKQQMFDTTKETRPLVQDPNGALLLDKDVSCCDVMSNLQKRKERVCYHTPVLLNNYNHEKCYTIQLSACNHIVYLREWSNLVIQANEKPFLECKLAKYVSKKGQQIFLVLDDFRYR